MEKFETPKIETIRFQAEDVITASGNPGVDLCDDETPFEPFQ